MSPPAERGPATGGIDRRFRILNWIGIIDQLATTQANRLLAETDLPFPQFVMLTHFHHRPDEGKTVTGIAAAFQQPQPGVTKTAQKLVAKGFLERRPDPEDGRIRRLHLSAAGRRAYGEALARFEPALVRIFEGWTVAELSRLFADLERLRAWLDVNRP